MSNLILEKDKKKIKSEYLGRLSAVVLSASLFVFLLGVILILPSFILLKGRMESVEERLSFLKSYIESQKDATTPLIIQKTKESLKLLSAKEPEKVFEAVRIIVLNEGDSVSLDSFSFVILPDGKAQVSISGVSKDRDSLITFRKRLEAERKFNRVNLPISNLAESADIEFSMNLDIEQNAEEN